MNDYKELQRKKDELDKLIQKAYKEEAEKALADVIAVIKKYNFTAQQCFPLPGADGKKKLPDKYYDPNTGNAWNGKGRVPKWLQGKNLADFEIQVEPERKFTLQTDHRNPFPIA